MKNEKIVKGKFDPLRTYCGTIKFCQSAEETSNIRHHLFEEIKSIVPQEYFKQVILDRRTPITPDGPIVIKWQYNPDYVASRGVSL